jgi:hypothetical protein
MAKAAKELRKVPKGHEHHATYARIKQAADDLEKEIDADGQRIETELTERLQASGPLVLQMEEGECRVVAASPHVAGGGQALLPRDLLSVWRVAEVFHGSVVLGGSPSRLTFGDREQVATIKHETKNNKKLKAAEAGEGRLFE